MTPPAKPRRRRFRLLAGGRHRGFDLAGVELVIAEENDAPFPVDAIAVEEDSFLVLSADPIVRPPQAHFLKVFTELLETEPAPLGSVLLRSGQPLRLLAVVHDLSLTPTWKEHWVREALHRVIGVMETRRKRVLGLYPLGCVFGQLAPARFLSILSEVIADTTPLALRRIWLMVSSRSDWPDPHPLTSLEAPGDRR